MITKCPKCNTAFKVSQEQLAIAKGKVRCGSCMSVFEARQHQVDQSPPTLAADKKPRKQDDAAPIRNISAEEDEAWALKLLEDSEGSDTPLQDNVIEPKPKKNSGGAIQTEPVKAPHGNTANKDIDFEEFSDGFQELQDYNEGGPKDFFSAIEEQTQQPDNTASSDHWAEEMLHQLEQESDASLNPTTQDINNTLDELGIEPDEVRSALSASEQEQVNDLMSDDPLGLGALEHDLEFDQDPDYDDATDPQMLLSSINVEPVELSLEREHERNLKRNLTHGSLILLASFLLAGQYLFFQFDQLARNEEFRPFYEKVCGFLPCQLPVMHDVTKIRGSNLIVRSHPNYLNALIVDAIISNRAIYQQDFPLVELTFSDINDVVVASRIFTPEEYLTGELDSLHTMPPRTPIHLTLEIVDPGATAVNYEIQFHPNQNS